jgi:hypothetical protein
MFRKHFLTFFNKKEDCGFEFYECNKAPHEYDLFVVENFKKLNGKCFCTIDNRLLLAKHNDDNELADILKYFTKLNELK